MLAGNVYAVATVQDQDPLDQFASADSEPESAWLSFRDVPVVPYTDILDGPGGGMSHRGGPVWPSGTRRRSRDTAGAMFLSTPDPMPWWTLIGPGSSR